MTINLDTTSADAARQRVLDTVPSDLDAVRQVRTRQGYLRAHYARSPEDAWVIDTASSEMASAPSQDPQHARIKLGRNDRQGVDIGVHKAVGGLCDLPNPGEILCGALAACTDSTIRMAAAAVNVPIEELSVHVAAKVDTRGTLFVSPDTPVGFQQMSVRIKLRLAEGTEPRLRDKLLSLARHCCIVMQTLRHGVPVDARLEALD
ncbi:MAG: OsmC family protein [Myxococcales bacterium]|nr:OsmC family protein [Myxococcales bacterium]